VWLKSVSSSSSRPVWTSNSSFIWSEISRCRLMECDRRSSWLSCSAKGLQSSPADETEQRTGHHLLLRLQHGIGLIGCLRVVGIRSVYRLCGRRGDQLRWRPHRLQAAERSRSVEIRAGSGVVTNLSTPSSSPWPIIPRIRPCWFRSRVTASDRPSLASSASMPDRSELRFWVI
jgi:hypothetical protein